METKVVDMDDLKVRALMAADNVDRETAISAIEDGDWLVCTDEEADEAATDYIRESLWAFRPEFLAGETGLDAEMFAFASDKCEGANPAILRTVEATCGLESFVQSAIGADGRGHFLAGYDGNEVEETIDGVDFYLYRVS
mgnify:CR=1 FL=1